MTPLWWRRTLTVGDRGPAVSVVQRKLGMPTSGLYDQGTAIAVRGLQADVGLPTSGDVDELTARWLGPRATDGVIPDWYNGEPVYPREQRYAVVLQGHSESWLRRFQGNHDIEPTGMIDEQTAILLGAHFLEGE